MVLWEHALVILPKSIEQHNHTEFCPDFVNKTEIDSAHGPTVQSEIVPSNPIFSGQMFWTLCVSDHLVAMFVRPLMLVNALTISKLKIGCPLSWLYLIIQNIFNLKPEHVSNFLFISDADVC